MSSNNLTNEEDDDKWGVSATDDNVPPQIARLSSPGYKTFLDDNEALLPNKSIPFDDAGFSDVSCYYYYYYYYFYYYYYNYYR